MRDLKETRFFRRVLTYCIGLLITAFGVAFAINSHLGISPIASLPFVLSHIFTHISLGTLTAMALVCFVMLQILVLRQEFNWWHLSQIPASTLYGYFVDLTRFLLGGFQLPTYFGQLTMLAISITLIAVGTALLYLTNFAMLPSGNLCVAISKKTNYAFHRIKITLDCTLSTTSIALSFLFLGSLVGVREGTVITAIFVGKLIPLAAKLLTPLLQTLGVPVRE